jgi:hypothetical protein
MFRPEQNSRSTYFMFRPEQNSRSTYFMFRPEQNSRGAFPCLRLKVGDMEKHGLHQMQPAILNGPCANAGTPESLT